MKQIRNQLTYANVMSSLAVFLVLAGGTAFAAAQLGKNSVGTKQLKKNAVTAKKIKKGAVATAKLKNNAVTTGKIANGAVTGAKVNLGSLGTVPNAAHATKADTAGKADEATKAGTATKAATATNFSRYINTDLKKASIGQSVTIASLGPFTFTGTCEDKGAGNYEAKVLAATSSANSYFVSDDENYYSGDFQPGEQASVLGELVDGTEPNWVGEYGFSYYDEFAAASSDGGIRIRGTAEAGVHVFGADCVFAMQIMDNS